MNGSHIAGMYAQWLHKSRKDDYGKVQCLHMNCKNDLKHFFIKSLKFGLTGMIGLIIDFSLTWLLKERWGVNPYVANGAGFTVAASANFVINKIWTFQDKSRKILQQFTAFFLISLIGLSLNSAFLYVFYQYAGFSFYVGKMLAIVVVFLWNFTANHFYTFGKTSG